MQWILTDALDSQAILRRLRADYRAGQKYLLIVPDRFTLSYERAALEILGKTGSFDLEVASFSRLADKTLGNRIYRLLDAQSEVMLLRKVIEEQKDNLTCFASSAQFTGFASEMYAAISQIRKSAVGIEDLQRAIAQLSARAAAKTRDIVTVYAAYIAALGQTYTDGTGKLEALAHSIRDGAYAEYRVYVSDFTAMSAVETKVVEQLMLHTQSLTVCLPDGDGDNAFLYPKPLYDRIAWLAESNGVRMQIEREATEMGKDMRAIARGLFGLRAPDVASDGGQIALIRARDPEDEAREIARRILHAVRVDGLRYRDIAIVDCCSARYASVVRGVFADYGIPYYMDVKVSLSKQAAANLLSAALRAVGSGYRARDVIAFAKNPLLGIEYAQVCEFENYCLQYAIDYTRFRMPFELGDDARRAAAEHVRARIWAALQPLAGTETTVGGRVRAVRAFFERNRIAERNEELALRQIERGDAEQAVVTQQCCDKILQLCARMEAMMSEVAMSGETFERILSSAIQSVQVSNVPMFVDSVFIGQSGQSRYEHIRRLFVMGASSDVLPVEHADGAIVSERETRAWNKLGIAGSPDVKARNRASKFDLLMTLVKPSEQLIVSYCEAATDGRVLAPSAVIEQIAELTGARVEPTLRPAADWDAERYAEYCASDANALHELLEMRARIADGIVKPSDVEYRVMDMLYDAACARHGRDRVDLLLSGERAHDECVRGDGAWGDGTISASRLEKYLSCPFQHYMDYVLRARRREEADLQVSDTGSILHAIMERYFSYPDACELSADAIRTRVDALLDELIARDEKLQRLHKTDNGKATLYQVRRRAAFLLRGWCAEMRYTRFRPQGLETRFGFPDAAIPPLQIRAADKTLRLQGVIDRIDVCKDRYLILDYKSKSRIDFDASGILYGDRIQMFLYLRAMMQQGDLRPAGVFYLLMNDKIVRRDSATERMRLKGYLAADGDEILDFDSRLGEANTESGLFPVASKTDTYGSIVYGGNLLSYEQLEQVSDYVLRLAQKAASEIEQGYSAPAPLACGGIASVCKYCAYKTACAIDRHPERVRNAPKVGLAHLLERAKPKEGTDAAMD